jgi:hypothetical protein
MQALAAGERRALVVRFGWSTLADSPVRFRRHRSRSRVSLVAGRVVGGSWGRRSRGWHRPPLACEVGAERQRSNCIGATLLVGGELRGEPFGFGPIGRTCLSTTVQNGAPPVRAGQRRGLARAELVERSPRAGLGVSWAASAPPSRDTDLGWMPRLILAQGCRRRPMPTGRFAAAAGTAAVDGLRGRPGTRRSLAQPRRWSVAVVNLVRGHRDP